MRKSFLLSENVVIKCENPFMERKHRLEKRKRDYSEKMSLEKTYALIEGKRRSQSRKGTPPFRFRYLDAYSLVNMRFRSGKVLSPYLLRRFLSEKSFRLSGARFRLVNAFSPLRGTYSLGVRFSAFASHLLTRQSRLSQYVRSVSLVFAR